MSRALPYGCEAVNVVIRRDGSRRFDFEAVKRLRTPQGTCACGSPAFTLAIDPKTFAGTPLCDACEAKR